MLLPSKLLNRSKERDWRFLVINLRVTLGITLVESAPVLRRAEQARVVESKIADHISIGVVMLSVNCLGSIS